MSLSLHACSLWPGAVDWLIFSLHLEGLTTQEISQCVVDETAHFTKQDDRKSRHLSNQRKRQKATSRELTPNDTPLVPPAGCTAISTAGRSSSRDEITGAARGALEPQTKRVSYEDVTQSLAESGPNDSSGNNVSSGELLIVTELVEEQQQLYHYLAEVMLVTPHAFVSSPGVMMAVRDRLHVVEMFYNLDEGLAELWFGDRLSRIDVEDDDLVEVGLPGIREDSVKRQWRNLKRVCKVITSAYRGRDGMYIPRDVPITTAIQQTFVLPITLSRRYATIVFGFEHRLDSSALESFDIDELATLCAAIGACWCDESQLLLNEGFVKSLWRVGKLLDDSRVISELASLILGQEGSRIFRQIKDTFDEMHKAIASGQPAAATTSLSQSSSAASLPDVKGHATVPVQGVASPPLGDKCGPVPQSYSRRFVSEFHSVVKHLSKICIQFSASEKVRDVFDRYHSKVYSAMLTLGKADNVAMSDGSYIASATVANSSALTATLSATLLNGSVTTSSLAIDGCEGGVAHGDSRRYVRELSTLLGSLEKTFNGLQCISAKDHEELDHVFRDFLSVLRLFTQLLLAHE